MMTPEQVEALIQRHIQRYAKIEIQDVYKLLHDAVFGPGHAVKRKAEQEWVERQKVLLEAASAQPLLESIHPEDAVVRLSLRPYLEVNGNLKKLIDAFVESAKAINGDLETMAAWWGIFQGMIEKDHALAERFDPRTAALIARARAQEHWPATHHSSAYEEAYKPIYRVLTRPLAEHLLQEQKLPITLI